MGPHLIRSLVHVTNVTFFGLEDARLINLKKKLMKLYQNIVALNMKNL